MRAAPASASRRAGGASAPPGAPNPRSPTAEPTLRLADPLALRYGGFYAAFFLAIGILLPFWPVWLAGRGLSPDQIGLLLALVAWIRVLGTPAIGRLADATGRPWRVLVACAGVALLGFAALLPARGFWPILLLSLVAWTSYQAMGPLSESQVLAAVRRRGLDYGRLRLWGSIAFVVGSVGAGRLLTGRDPDLVLQLVLGALAATLLATILLPRAAGAARPPGASGLRSLLLDPRFLLFLGAGSLLQASHGVLYGFSALAWSAAGHSETTIGWLWAEGTIAEILLFAVAGRLFARARPTSFLIVAGLAGLVRWSGLAMSDSLPLLVLLQLLHGATFGAAHLGAIYYIARRAPLHLAATAQSLYAALAGGLAMGLAVLVAGRLFAAYGSAAFFAMTGLSAAGLLLAFELRRRAPKPE
ncbi:MAG TPA: MFS transporter, partial [Kiloniellales bacterium]|nr:MFS transporter [Kiloniellales bacterium]